MRKPGSPDRGGRSAPGRLLLVAALLLIVVGFATPARAQDGDDEPLAPPADRLTVVTTELRPFVIDDDGRPDGFYAEVWDEVAREMGVTYDVLWVDSFAELLPAVERGAADLALAPLAPTAAREARYDFSSSVISSGPQLGYHQRIERRGSLVRALVSWPVLRILLVGLAGLAVLGHLIWWVERGSDDEHFHRSYPLGVWDGFWWAAVTATTVGYGDKSPATNRGRVVALAGMLASLFLVGAFVSQITSILEANRFQPPFTDLDSLAATPVGVVEGSSFAAFVEAEGAIIVPFGSQAEVFAAAGSGAVDAVVANPFALAEVGPRHGVTATGDVLYEEFETFGLAQGSPWREPVNQALADIQAEGEVAEIVARWNG